MKNSRVLHLFNHYLPQTENWAYNLIINTPDIEVYVGARRYLKHNFYNSNFTFYEHPYGGLDWQYIQWDKSVFRDLIKKIIYKLFKPLLGDMRKGLNSFIVKNHINIIHAHFGDVGWYYHKLPKKNKIPFVISFYGWDYDLLPNLHPIYEKRFKILFEEASLFLCEGAYAARNLEEKGCPKNKIRVQHLGVNVESIPFLPRKKKQGTLRLVQIAGLAEKKGQIYSLRALAEILSQDLHVELTIVGQERDKGYKTQMMRIVEDHGLREHVTFIDHIDYASIYQFLSQFDAFIQPSCHSANGDSEGGAPVALLDAQATGMPVISTFHCDIPEQVLHMKTGILGREKNVEDLIDNIEYFYQMTEGEFLAFSIRARQHIEERFDSRKNSTHLKLIYSSLV